MTGDIKSHYEVVVVGAGVSGIYQIKRLADLGVYALVLDAAPISAEPGTGTAIRARASIRELHLRLFFSKELLNEWHWKERFSAQPEPPLPQLRRRQVRSAQIHAVQS